MSPHVLHTGQDSGMIGENGEPRPGSPLLQITTSVEFYSWESSLWWPSHDCAFADLPCTLNFKLGWSAALAVLSSGDSLWHVEIGGLN